MADSQISRLLGTTKATIDQIRNRTHWNSANIKPVDPVTLGLSTQLELDAVVRKAAGGSHRFVRQPGVHVGVLPADVIRPAVEQGRRRYGSAHGGQQRRTRIEQRKARAYRSRIRIRKIGVGKHDSVGDGGLAPRLRVTVERPRPG